MYYNKKTNKVISDEDYAALSPEEQKNCVVKKGGGKPKRGRQDYQWYHIAKQVTDAVASVPMNAFVGVKQELEYVQTATSNPSIGGVTTATTEIPGVFALQVALTYGDSKAGTSAMNMASKALYSFVRHMNSGRTNYDSPDLMTYVMAMDQVYSAIFHAKRAYQVAMTYTYENKAIPKELAYALGYDVEDISKNLANFRARLNLLIAKATALCVPKIFNIHKRHAFIMSNVFLDASSIRGQMYVFRPMVWLKWSATTSTTGSSLQSQSAAGSSPGGAQKAQELLDTIEDLLDVLIYDEDINIMSGDILKAFGESGLYNLDFLNENETISFLFNEDVLAQIENAHAFPLKVQELYQTRGSYSITQLSETTDLVTKEPQLANSDSNVASMKSLFINSHKDDVTPEDIMEWTRLMCINNYTDSTLSYGTELVIGYNIYNNATNPDGIFVDTLVPLRNEYMSSDGSYGSFRTTAEVSAALSMFDWHPVIYYFDSIPLSGEEPPFRFELVGVQADLKRAGVIGFNTIKQLNDAAVMGSINTLDLIKTAKVPNKY